jgi:hypothetical protein
MVTSRYPTQGYIGGTPDQAATLHRGLQWSVINESKAAWVLQYRDSPRPPWHCGVKAVSSLTSMG